MKTHSIEQAVRYIETDRMKVVHHSTYLTWFEVGRTSLLAAAGFPYHELEASGTRFPVIEYSCRMTGVADYGDTVRIDTAIESLRSRTVVFSYRAYNRDQLIATGISKHIAVDGDHKPRRMERALVDALQEYVVVKSETRNR
ncbi:MAG: thioesterase family protein [Candidatus Krumholzibacteria bacterium]